MYRETQRCKKCVLPKTPRTPFNDDGICALCLKSLSDTPVDWSKRYSQLLEMIDKIRILGHKRKYDCVVGISGGRDSTYMLYRLVRNHNLRCLAVHYRTPFASDVVKQNIQNAVSELGVDLVPINLSQTWHCRASKQFLTLWKKYPKPEIASLICSPCKLINREMFRLARERNIRAIIYAGNSYERFDLGGATFNIKTRKHVHSLENQLRKEMTIVGRGLSLIAKHPHVLRCLPVAIKGSILYVNNHTIFLRARFPSIRSIEYFQYARWEESHCLDTIRKKLDWQKCPHSASTWRMDCRMGDVKNLLFNSMYGLTYVDSLYSNMVRAGVMTREEALERARKESSVSNKRLSAVTSVLELPKTFWQDIPITISVEN